MSDLMPRRVRRVCIDADMLLTLLRAQDSDARFAYRIEGLPGDARAVGVVVPFTMPHAVSIAVESATFAPVGENTEPPYLHLTVYRIQREGQ